MKRRLDEVDENGVFSSSAILRCESAKIAEVVLQDAAADTAVDARLDES